MTETADVIVIGSGIAGLSAAERLRRDGRHVIVVDKGRRPGGRFAWRAGRDGRPGFAHGMPWVPRDLAVLLPGRLSPHLVDRDLPEPGAFAADPDPGALTDAFAKPFGPRQGVAVRAIRRYGGGWLLDGDGPEGPCSFAGGAVVSTLPPAQALTLFDGRPCIEAVEAVRMTPCWTLMASFDTVTGLDPAQTADEDRLVAEHLRPGVEARGEAWTYQVGPDVTRGMLDLTREAAVAPLLARLAGLCDAALPAPATAQAHRWLYARCEAPLGMDWLSLGEGLVLAGDWLPGGDAAGAVRSGRAAAGAI